MDEIEIIEEPKDLKEKKPRFNYYLISILLMCILGTCIFMAVKVLSHYDAFSENALLFGAEQYDINLCNCFTNKNVSFFFNQSSIWQIRTGKPIEIINFSTIEDIVIK